MRVLVTGSAGRIGRAAVAELRAQGVPVRGFDIGPTPGLDDALVGSITDAPLLRRAMAGVETLIHLAATPDDDDFHSRLLPNNLVGVYEVLEAAREADVKRIVLASTGQVVWWQRLRGPVPVGPDDAPTPRGWYAATKLFLEGAGRMLSGADGRTVLAVRLGWCPRDAGQAREIAGSVWAQDVYLSPGDAGRFFAAAARCPLDGGFHVVYAMSKPVRSATYDDGPARRLGYEPRDVWPAGADEMLG
ncbi:MAG: NAD-dependent epimerase/dehydratase family protein [Gemmataceae bacterium]